MGFNYASFLVSLNRKNEAIPIFEDLVNKFPLYPLAYSQLVNIYIEQNDYEPLYRLLVKMEGAYMYNQNGYLMNMFFAH